MNDNEKIKLKILKLSKNPIWVSELYRELIRTDVNIAWPKFLNMLDDMEKDGKIKFDEKGNMKFVEVVKK